MLTHLRATGFKSLADFEIDFPRLTVLFGPNASGKSNIIEAAQMLSRCATERTLSEAFQGSVRGYPIEVFAFPPGGLPEMHRRERVSFELEADLAVGDSAHRYRARIALQPAAGGLTVEDEHLCALTKKLAPSRHAASIETVSDGVRVRAKGKGAHPRYEPRDLNHTLLSDPRFTGNGYHAIESCRAEFDAWRVYYLDPRVAMRSPKPPAVVRDIGVLGGDVAPFLFRLRAEQPKAFASAVRALTSIIPSVEQVAVSLDERQGTLDIQVTQDGVQYSSRIVSEGTLRVLALCAIAVNPWSRGLVAFEEPENGVHPRRLELIARLLCSMAIDQGRQVIVTTHSPLFCEAVLAMTRDSREHARLYAVRKGMEGTHAEAITHADTLLESPEIAEDLAAPAEDGLLTGALLRGWLDE